MTPLLLPSWWRARRMVQRNLLVYKHGWMIVLSGFFEPLFYLLSLGIGLGSMVPDIGNVSYAAFVAPGLLASSCMNGALTDGCFNIFFKLHFQRTYEGILATPMRVADIVCGETVWALTRGSMYAAMFLLVMLLLGTLTGRPILLSPWAGLALPAAILAAASFSAMAVCVTTFIQRIEHFDVVVGLLVTPMFLFSGTFFPISRLPSWLQAVVQVSPLYHAIELLRQLMTGAIQPSALVHVAYLFLAGGLGFAIAMLRLERALIK